MNSLHERHRPRTWSEVVGQDLAVSRIRAVIARGWGGRAWWITGNSGSGKSTLARLIAEEGADRLNVDELDAQLLTPARVRDLEYEMRTLAIGEKSGRAYIVNEAHGLRRDTIRLLLVLLERLPRHVVFVFTTTKAGQQSLFEDDETGDASPLLSRCTEVVLDSSDQTNIEFARRAHAVAKREGLPAVPLDVYVAAARKCRGNMRALLQRIESGTFMDDAVEALERDLALIQSTKGAAAERRRGEIQTALEALAAHV